MASHGITPIGQYVTFTFEALLEKPIWNDDKLTQLRTKYPKLHFHTVDNGTSYHVTIWPNFSCFEPSNIKKEDIPTWLYSWVGDLVQL
jgi:hypothetical protein